MVQKLVSPYKEGMLICGYKVKPYEKDHGYTHFGIDLKAVYKKSSDRNIYASGLGVVISAGKDNNLGYCFCINYPQCLMHDGEVKNICVKYMHCKKSYVKVGEVVTKESLIAIEGKEGCEDYHVHFEVDTDLVNPRYTPQCKTSNYWIHGYDSTLNPTLFLYNTDERKLVESNYNASYLNEGDKIKNIPTTEITDYGVKVNQCVDDVEEDLNKALNDLARIRKLV